MEIGGEIRRQKFKLEKLAEGKTWWASVLVIEPDYMVEPAVIGGIYQDITTGQQNKRTMNTVSATFNIYRIFAHHNKLYLTKCIKMTIYFAFCKK